MARLGRHVEVALSKVDLSIAQYRVLAQLGEGAEASSSLAAKLAVSRPSITAVVEGLVQRGLVDRRQSAGDRRWVSVELTDSGRAVLAAADDAVTTRLVTLLAELDPAQVDTAVTGISQWQVAIDARRVRADAARGVGPTPDAPDAVPARPAPARTRRGRR